MISGTLEGDNPGGLPLRLPFPRGPAAGRRAILSEDDVKELRKLVALSRRQPVNFGFCLGKKAPEDVLLLHKIKSPKMLGRAAKEAGTSPKILFGTFATDEKIVTLTSEVPPITGVARRIRLLLRQAKLNLTIRLLGPDGEVAEEDRDEEDEGGGAESGATPEETPAEDGGETAAYDRLRAEIVALGRDHRAELSEQVAARLSAVLKAADAARAGGRIADGLALLRQLQGELDTALADGGSGGGEASDGPSANAVAAARAALVALAERTRDRLSPEALKRMSADLKEADALARAGDLAGALARLQALTRALEQASGGADLLPVWNATREDLDRQIELLKAALRSFRHPDLDRIAEVGFNAFTDGRNTKLMAALFDFKQSPTPQAAAKVEAAIARYEELLGSGSVLDDYDDNPFGVRVTLRQTLTRGLDALRAGLAGRG